MLKILEASVAGATNELGTIETESLRYHQGRGSLDRRAGQLLLEILGEGYLSKRFNIQDPDIGITLESCQVTGTGERLSFLYEKKYRAE